MSLAVTLADVEAAAAVLEGVVARTPSAVSETLSEILGCTVIVKFESMQFTASYKERGARNRLVALSEGERAGGVVAVSAGNHAQAVARHAALLGIPATIVMPRGTPFVKIERTRHHGATVELVGDDLTEAMARGRALQAAGATLIHPYDDARVIAGQGTVALELFADHPDLEVIVAPVGGGGLLAGMAVAAAALAPHVELVGVQSATWPSMAVALAGAGECPGGPTLAEGIAVREAGRLTQPIIAAHTSGVVTVTEAGIEDAVNLLLEVEKVVVEGAGAAGIAALAAHRERFADRRVAVVLTGGNIDPRLLASIVQRGLVRAGKLVRLRVAIDDRPGALAALLDVVGDAGANLVEVVHQRLFVEVGARTAGVDLTIECMDAEHREAVVSALVSAGHPVEWAK